MDEWEDSLRTVMLEKEDTGKVWPGALLHGLPWSTPGTRREG